MAKAVEESKKIESIVEPKFIDPTKLTTEQLTDPDYSLKQLMKMNGSQPIVCSKCHHCRR